MTEEDVTEVKVTEAFVYGGETREPGEIVELPNSAAESTVKKGYGERVGEEESPEVEKPERGEEVEETMEESEKSWEEMEEKLDDKPEIPPRWNPARSDVKSGEISAEDVDDLIGTVKRMDVHQKYDTPMAVIDTVDGGEATVFQQKAIEDLFEEMEVGDRIAVRFTGLEHSARGFNYLTYRYDLYGQDGKKLKLSR